MSTRTAEQKMGKTPMRPIKHSIVPNEKTPPIRTVQRTGGTLSTPKGSLQKMDNRFHLLLGQAILPRSMYGAVYIFFI